MSDLQVTLRLKADGSNLVAVVRKAKEETSGIGPAASGASAQGSKAFGEMTGVVDRLRTSASRAQSIIATIGVGAGLVAMATQVARTADEYSGMTSRLRLATTSQAEFATAQARTFEIAQRTSSQLDATVNLYARLASAVLALNGTQEDAFAITEAVNQSFAISGATAAESAGTIRQFAQALASGVLRGDEFNSIMEQSPRLVDAMTKSLKVTRGELRALAEDGKLSSKVVLDSILKQKDAIERDFASMPLTIGRAWQQLGNATTAFIGQADQASGASRSIADSIAFVARNVDTLATAIVALSTVMLTRFVASAIPAAIAGLRAYVTQLALSAAATSAFNVGVAGAGAQLTGFAGAAANLVSRVGGIPVIVTGAIASIIMLGRAGKERLEEMQAALEQLGETRRRLNAEETRRRAEERAANSDLILQDIKSLEKSMARERGRPIYQGMLKELEKLKAEYLAASTQSDAFNQTLIGQREQIDKVIKGSQTRLSQMQEEQIRMKGGEQAVLQHRLSTLQASAATDEQRKAITALLKELPKAESGLKGVKAANEIGEAAAKDHAQAIDNLQRALEDYTLEAMTDLERAEFDHVLRLRAIAAEGGRAIEASRKLGKAKSEEGEIQKLVTQIIDRLTVSYKRSTDEIKKNNEAIANRPSIVEDATANLRQEVELLGLSNEQRAIREALMTAEARAREEERALRPEERAQIEATTSALYRQGEAIQAQIDLSSAYRSAWQGAINSVASAFGDFASRGFKGWKDFLGQLKDALKRWVAEVITIMAQRALTNMFTNFLTGASGSGSGGGFWSSLFGMGGSSGALNGGAGQSYGVLATATGRAGGGGMNLGSLLGGGGSLGSLATTLGPALPWLGPLAGAAYGLQNPGNNAGATAARVGSYGYAGYALGTVGYGALLGGAAGAATGAGIGATVGGAASGAMGAAAAIPIVGWIVAALALIDAVSGGKLFGTKYQTKSATSSLLLGPDGANASVTLHQERQAAFFGGIRRRDQSKPATPEMIAAAQQLFNSIENVMIDSARRLEIETPPMIEAALRTVNEYDKKGKVKATKHFVDVVIEGVRRSFAEATPELASTRLAAEAYLATVAASVAAAASSVPPVLTPEQVANMVVGDMTGDDIVRGFDREGGRFTIRDGGSPGGGAGGAVGAAQALTNEVHIIAERWRSDAELLMQGAQFLLQAQEDIVKGRSLLGDGGTLTQLTNLVEDLQRGEEQLSETYSRVYQATSLLDDALELAGVTMDRTREEVVRFATSIADAAGGIERAQQLWSGFFEGFYGQGERAVNRIAQLQAQVTAQAASLGLDEAINAADFRAQFEAALPTLEAGDVVRWLEFGQALLQLNQARDQVTQAERQYAAFLLNLAAELGEAGPRNAFEGRLMEIRAQTAGFIAQANELARAAGRAGASETELALIHRWTARQVEMAIAQLEQSARALVAELGYTGLSAIEAEIARLESLGSSGGFGGLGDSVEDLFGQFQSGLQNLDQYLNSMLFGDLSGITPEQQLAEARRQLEQTAVAARNGDVSALNNLQSIADTFLRLSRGFNASGDDYNVDFNYVRSLLDGISNPYSPGGGNVAPVELVPSAELLALYAQRDAIVAQEEAQRRLALATELAAQISQLAQVQGQTWFAVADRMGVRLDRFVVDLGATSTASTTEQVQALAGVANTLNVELTSLAERLGLELGQLRDANSLLNDAFEERLAQIPANMASEIAPTWEEFISAASTEQAAEALERLNQLTNNLPEQFRLQLAPYLESVDPETRELLSDLEYLESVDENTATANTLLRQILAALQTPAEATALIAKVAGYPVTAGAEILFLDELRALRATVARLEAKLEEVGGGTVSAIDRNTKATVTATHDAAVLVAGSRSDSPYGRVSGAYK